MSDAMSDNLDAESALDHAKEVTHLTPRLYVLIWAILLALVALTLALGELNLGRANFPIAFAIAMTKAVLIILFFMHVLYSPGLVRIVAFAGFFWLAIMLGLTFADYLSRGWLTPEVAAPSPNVPGTGFDRP